jgi:hypothetical protein
MLHALGRSHAVVVAAALPTLVCKRCLVSPVQVRAEQDTKKSGNVFGDASDDEDEGAPKALARKVELPGQQVSIV